MTNQITDTKLLENQILGIQITGISALPLTSTTDAKTRSTSPTISTTFS